MERLTSESYTSVHNIGHCSIIVELRSRTCEKCENVITMIQSENESQRSS